MELFLPSILIFLLALIVVMVLIPQFSPIIIVTCAIVLLSAGLYNHFSMFWNEYAQSTWQTSLKTFAPGILVIAIFVYLFFAIGAFFTGGKVPIPVMPEMSTPTTTETATNVLTSSIGNTMNATKNLFGANESKGSNAEGPVPEEKPRSEERPNNNVPAPKNNNVGRILRRPNNNMMKNVVPRPMNGPTRSQLGAI